MHCEGCRCEENARVKASIEAEQAVKAKLEAGEPFSDAELVYAAYSRCLCGAGMAYPKGIGPFGSWDCSAILKGEATPKGQPGSVKHEGKMPFMFWEVKSESQPSANGATTRPQDQKLA